MKINFIKTIALTILLSAALPGCINDDDYGNPNMDCVEPAVTVNKTVAEVFAAATTTMQQYTADDVIEAYVNSSDERGNFFKTVYMQTIPADGVAPIGFSVAIDKTTLFGAGFYPGRKVYIKLKGLYFAKVYNGLAIGANYNGAVGRISEAQYKNFVMPSCSEIGEDELVRTLTISEALTAANLNTLIEIENVQFDTPFVGGTYYDKYDTANTAGGSTNRKLIDADGNKIIFRTSSFANFSGNIIPGNSGKVRGVLTKYSNDYQFIARSGDDIKLTEERFGANTPPGGSTTAKGGTAIAYMGSFTETFESYALDATTFPKYVNDYTVGGRYWELNQFPTGTGNKYIEMTSFSGSTNPGVVANTYFIVPVDFTAASTFKFDKEIRYMAGQCLKVYYATAAQYTALGAINPANFTDITASFTGLTYPATGASQNSFTTAGTYNIPASLTGNGFFVFEYAGTATITTTVQLDNITVN